ETRRRFPGAAEGGPDPLHRCRRSTLPERPGAPRELAPAGVAPGRQSDRLDHGRGYGAGGPARKDDADGSRAGAHRVASRSTPHTPAVAARHGAGALRTLRPAAVSE